MDRVSKPGLKIIDSNLFKVHGQGVKTALKIIDNNLFKVDWQGVKTRFEDNR